MFATGTGVKGKVAAWRTKRYEEERRTRKRNRKRKNVVGGSRISPPTIALSFSERREEGAKGEGEGVARPRGEA